MRVASIDIGSNTVLLLIAEISNSQLIPIINEYRIPRISSGLANNGFISEESIEKLFKILKEYKAIIAKHNCEKIIVNGTQALRVADNSEQIKREIKEEFGFELNIISGETEALYSFKGALSSFTDNCNYVMIDIGGASTEIVCGNNREIFFKKSFAIGTVTGKEKFLKSNPPTLDEIKCFEAELCDIFEELSKVNSNNSSIIAVAGTPTTLSALKQNLIEYSETKIEKSLLTIIDLEYFISEFRKKTFEEINNQFSPIIAGREDVILAGTLILQYLLSLLKKEKLYVSSRGLRYGAI
ncbi:MAG: hypothetical protein L3J41_12910 [Melioribacteraceae bacterium]|nr:hypothetical protein [Melioribacteraceae bacterium]